MARTIEFGDDGMKRVTDDGVKFTEPTLSVDLTPVTRTPQVSRTQAQAAANMKYAGASYEDIADFLDYKDAAVARRVVEEAIARAYPDESRESLFRITAARLEVLLNSISHGTKPEIPALDPDDGGPIFDRHGNTLMKPNPDQLAYVKVAGDLIARQMKLHGLEAPTQIQITPDAEKLEQAIAMITAQTLDQQISVTTQARVRRSIAVNYPVEIYPLVLEAARQRNMSMTAYQRRAVLAFAQADTGFDWFEQMATEPGIGSFNSPGVSLPSGGHGFGHWRILQLGDFDA
ncbi:hypothetical protein Q3G72_006583 [Acer saccharum]|nr:hypothetical protein Q3G72_006583 [Acer saccharum]